MSCFHILYFSAQNLWFHALSHEFQHLAELNPGWSYSLLTHETAATIKPELTVIDLTTERLISASDLKISGPQQLVLVRASQRRHIHDLLVDSHCSLLCVDEPQFAIREVVECCCRQKRFLSPRIRQMLDTQPEKVQPVFFTEVEKKILALLRDGKKGIEISNTIFRSQKTISTHKRNIMRKLGVSDDFALKKKLKIAEI